MPKKDRAIKVSRTPDKSVAAARTARQPEKGGSSEKFSLARAHGAYAFIPAALALVFSINTLWNGFATDDTQQVLNNPFIKDLGNLPQAFRTSVWSFASSDIIFTVDSYFRPMFSMLFSINYALFGAAAWGWHFVNVLIHALVTGLLFLVLKEVTGRTPVALIAASLFAAHPAHAESIAWISGVTDPLMAVFVLPAFYLYLRYRKEGRGYLIWASAAFYFLAMLSKETAIALPALVVYCEMIHFKEQSPFKQTAIRAAKTAGVFALPTAIYFLMRYGAINSLLFGSAPRNPLGPTLATVPLAAMKYILLCLIPINYSYQHYTPLVERVASASFIIPVFILAIGAAALILSKSRMVAFAAVWFILWLLPSLAAIRQFDLEYLIQERYLYLPSVGFCLAVAIGIEKLSAHRFVGQRGRLAATALAAVLVIVWGIAYVKHNRSWQDTITVFRNCVAVEPGSPLAHNSLARAYYEAGRPREAEAEALKALELDQSCAQAYLSLSYFAHRSGQMDKAIEYLERGAVAIREGPLTRHNLATIHLNLGLLYSQRKEYDRAEKIMLRSTEILPRPVGWYYTGQFYYDQGRLEEARAMFELTSQKVPRWFAMIHLKLGQVYDRLGQTARARDEYERFLELTPPSAENRTEVMRRLQQL
jgi:protein O-mannosyl-transferase